MVQEDLVDRHCSCRWQVVAVCGRMSLLKLYRELVVTMSHSKGHA